MLCWMCGNARRNKVRNQDIRRTTAIKVNKSEQENKGSEAKKLQKRKIINFFIFYFSEKRSIYRDFPEIVLLKR